MNVGLVMPGFSASESDWCIPALLSLVRDLGRRHRVRVFALRYPHHRSSYPVFDSQVWALGGATARGAAKLPLLWRAVDAIVREHRRDPFDVLHAFWADEPGFVAVRAARSLGVSSVVSLLGGELVSLPEIGYGGRRSRLNRFLSARALSGASHVTAGSTHLASLAGPRVAPKLVPIGVDLDRFHPGEAVEGLLKGDPKLLHVASLVPVKDQRTLLHAFDRVRRALPDAALHVVGCGPLEETLRELARTLGIDDRVVFHGAVPHDELPPYYRSADLLVMSSLHEGQEWVTQEAAACGKAAVGTRVGVMRDLEPATTAVSCGDPEALARGMIEALSDRTKLRERGLLARERIVERYSLSGTLAALGAIYQS